MVKDRDMKPGVACNKVPHMLITSGMAKRVRVCSQQHKGDHGAYDKNGCFKYRRAKEAWGP